MAGISPFLRAQVFDTQSALNARSGININQIML